MKETTNSAAQAFIDNGLRRGDRLRVIIEGVTLFATVGDCSHDHRLQEVLNMLILDRENGKPTTAVATRVDGVNIQIDVL